LRKVVKSVLRKVIQKVESVMSFLIRLWKNRAEFSVKVTVKWCYSFVIFHKLCKMLWVALVKSVFRKLRKKPSRFYIIYGK